MSLHWRDFGGSNAARYGRKMILELGVKEPPVCQHEAAAFRGYEILELSEAELAAYPHINPRLHKMFTTACAHLIRSHDLILIKADQSVAKKRTDAFHEIGHDVFSLHAHTNFACSGASLDPMTYQRLEQEAFQCGVEMLLPAHLFVPDLRSLNVGLDAIQVLKDRYSASLEVTAMRYARLHPGLCAIAVAQPATVQQAENDGLGEFWLPGVSGVLEPSGNCARSWLATRTFGGQKIEIEDSWPMQLSYFAASNRFPKKFVPPRVLIPSSSMIVRSYAQNRLLRGELKASDLGSSPLRPPYFAECLPFGIEGDRKVLILLWLKDNQLNLLPEAA